MSRTPKPRPVYWLAGLALALVALSLAAVGLLAVRIDRVGEPAFVFLTWNLFLAWIPFVLSLVWRPFTVAVDHAHCCGCSVRGGSSSCPTRRTSSRFHPSRQGSSGVDDARQPGVDVWALPMLMLGRVRVQPVGSDGLKLLIFIAPRAHDRTHASYELVASRMLIMAGGHDVKPVGSGRSEALDQNGLRAAYQITQE
jgi:hypothetical protein